MLRRYWYKLDKEYVEKVAKELNKQLGDSARLNTVSEGGGGREN